MFLYFYLLKIFYSFILYQFSQREEQEKLRSIWSVVNNLPEANKNNLRYLMKFLHKLTERSAENKMSSQNLAIAIGPSLLWSNGESME